MKVDSTSYGAVRPAWDKKDCSVRALAVACKIPYDTASVLFAACGRSLKKGTSVELSRQIHEGKLKMEYVEEEMSLHHFTLLYNVGSWIVHRKGHAFAVVDGVVHDWEGNPQLHTRVLRAWRVTAATKAQVTKLVDLLM